MEDSTRTIFVVDDEPVIASTLTSILRNSGYDAHGFKSLHTAFAAAESMQPCLLITDIVLSSEDGLQLAIDIQRLHPGCKVLVMSGRIDAQILLSQRQLNFALLPKPTIPTELLAEVRALIG